MRLFTHGLFACKETAAILPIATPNHDHKRLFYHTFILISEFCHRALSGHGNIPHDCKYLRPAYNAGIYIF
jgi:hypothetical protein